MMGVWMLLLIYISFIMSGSQKWYWTGVLDVSAVGQTSAGWHRWSWLQGAEEAWERGSRTTRMPGLDDYFCCFFFFLLFLCFPCLSFLPSSSLLIGCGSAAKKDWRNCSSDSHWRRNKCSPALIKRVTLRCQFGHAELLVIPIESATGELLFRHESFKNCASVKPKWSYVLLNVRWW